MASAPASWQEIAAKKRAAAFSKIPKEWLLPESYAQKYNAKTPVSVLGVPRECGILSAADLDITEKYDAVALAEQVAAGKIKSVDVATAFSKRAAIAQQLTQCLTETFFEEAIERGKWLDEYLAKEGKVDSFKYKGYESTIGFVSFIGRPLPEDHSPLLKMLLDLGAILYCKTNIPQTLMTADSDNNIFGQTLNPNKLTLTAGGSSGGEGALVAMRGSILGVGTDIGGSIRIPALCNGTFGFKPSASRVPYGGQASPGRAGSPGVIAAAGPISTTFRDLQFFLENVISEEPWSYDPSSLAVRWRSVTPKSSLRIGFFVEDPSFPVSPPVKRTLETAAKKLAAAGHTIIPITPDMKEENKLIIDLFGLDNTHQSMQNILASGEPMVTSVAGLVSMYTIAQPHTLEGLYDLNVQRAAKSAKWQKIWVENKLDVVLCPPAETTAVVHDTYGNCPYTMLWNLLDYPGVIIPFGFADKNIDLDSLATPGTENIYSAEETDGAPCSVQVTARNLHDEELLAAASVISECLKA
ncbi:hypothetical protein BP5796_07715 [Coleophoma crateriformis]|uniref:amidase n=1 Tax=Coleophoma crateriformis TaxID=565419 RepID=A0A3D8RCR0_9HELO|nr:hypothetical protein BP5796_07715 [Coleophoma crateriformis]